MAMAEVRIFSFSRERSEDFFEDDYVAFLQIWITSPQSRAGSAFRQTTFTRPPGVEGHLVVLFIKRCSMHCLEDFGMIGERLRIGRGTRRNSPGLPGYGCEQAHFLIQLDFGFRLVLICFADLYMDPHASIGAFVHEVVHQPRMPADGDAMMRCS